MTKKMPQKNLHRVGLGAMKDAFNQAQAQKQAVEALCRQLIEDNNAARAKVRRLKIAVLVLAMAASIMAGAINARFFGIV